ncbi:MAG: GMC family oxidoreductase [Cyanobacteria bacterium J06560_5]
MFTIRFDTLDFRPDMLVTLRSDVKGWANNIAGKYADDAWIFELAEGDFPNGLNFKFVLENTYWSFGDNFFVQPGAGQTYAYGGQVQFPPMQELRTENPAIAQMFFQPDLDENKLHDVIVIGSGAGGGILADQLSDRGLDVLVLEAGSYLFPSHIANLPRQHQVGQFDKHVWGLWDEFQVTNYVNGQNSGYQGGQGFNLGGRSVFWGGLIPRMLSYEMDFWPQQIKWYLEDSGYQQAEDLMNRMPQVPSPYHRQVKSALRTMDGDYNYFDAPVAVQYNNGNLGTIPVGMFSTADLLMESRLTNSPQGNQSLTINLNHAVTNLEQTGAQITGVTTYDLIANKYRTYQAKTVVLSAGTVESAKLAMLSGLNDGSNKVGVGITDHPIFFTHFAIPAGSPFYSALDNSKIIFQHKAANTAPEAHPYNGVIELGADFNQGRYVDNDLLRSHLDARGETMLCEIVFLLNTPLVETNTLTQAGPSAAKPVVQMQPSPVTGELWNEMNDLKNKIINDFGGVPLANEGLDLIQANLGGVAHEVGTLRMGENPADSVVDTNLKFHGYNNLYACDLSVFPTSPAANPTLTLAALAMRLADHLSVTA